MWRVHTPGHASGRDSQEAQKREGYLEVLQQTSAGDFIPIDLFNIQTLGTKEPRNQDFQVFDEFVIYFYNWKQIHHYFKNPVQSSVSQNETSISLAPVENGAAGFPVT